MEKYIDQTALVKEIENISQTFSITHDKMIALWEKRKDELMKLSKEELVEMLIGKREHVGMTFG